MASPRGSSVASLPGRVRLRVFALSALVTSLILVIQGHLLLAAAIVLLLSVFGLVVGLRRADRIIEDATLVLDPLEGSSNSSAEGHELFVGR